MRLWIWRTLVVCLIGVSFCAIVTAQLTADQPIRLWPNGAPGALGSGPDDVPTLTPYLPKPGEATGAAFIVCPGGGYVMLAEHEGRPVAEWLNSVGVTAFVLKYRHGPRYRHPAPMQDAQRAIRIVRSHAAQWRLDPKRIGILGFSAGGHLASTVATHFDNGRSDASDVFERVSSRPDLAVLIYPVITMGAPTTHRGSQQALLGPHPSLQLLHLLSNDRQVTRDTPPTFLVHSYTDEGVPVENSLLLAEALRRNGVPFEMHIFERGPHGFGLAPNDPVLSMWPRLCANWLGVHGFAHPQSQHATR